MNDPPPIGESSSSSAPLLDNNSNNYLIANTLKMNDKLDEPKVRSVDAHDTQGTVENIILTTEGANQREHSVSFIEGCKRYPWAMFFSMFISLGVVSAAYDGQIITSFFAQPSFIARYGEDGEVSAPWQSGLSMGNPIGQILGSLFCTWPAEKFGRRYTLMLFNVCLAITIFIQFFAPSIQVLCVGEILAGLTWGTFIVLAPTYAAEVSPLAIRGTLEAFINLAFVIGQFIASGVAAGFDNRDDQWAYRIPFAIQWIWPVLMLSILPFTPESPYWLVRVGRREDAAKSLKKLAWSSGDESDSLIEDQLLIIEQTDLLERTFEKESSYWQCLKGTNLRRTEICSMIYSIQVLGGNPMIGYATYFFTLAGIPTSESFNLGIGVTAVGFVATCVSGIALGFFGRRTIYTFGVFFCSMCLILIGALDCAHNYDTNSSFAYAQASFLIIYTFCYQLTVGPLCFVLIGEVPSVQLKSRTIAIATAIQSVFSIASTVAVPYMFNTNEADWRGKTAFVFGGLAFVCGVWCWFRLPETKGRTFEEIDILFQKRVPTRKFDTVDLKKLILEYESEADGSSA